MSALPLLLGMTLFASPIADFAIDLAPLRAGGSENRTLEPGEDLEAPVLAGTQWCPRLDCRGPACERGEDTLLVDDCFELSAAGGATVTDGCVVFDQAGAATVTWMPKSCSAVLGGYDPGVNTLQAEVIAAEQTSAARRSYWKELVRDDLDAGARLEGGDGLDAMFAPAEALPVYAGSHVSFEVELRDERGRAVLWNSEQGKLLVESVNGGGVVAFELTDAGRAELVVESGDDSEISLALLGRSMPLARVYAIEADAITSIELVAVFNQSVEPAGFFYPLQLHAVARTQAGDIVAALPATWDVKAGALGLEVNMYSFEQEHLDVIDQCLRVAQQPSARTATMLFTLDGRTTSLPLEWELPAEHEVASTRWNIPSHFSIYRADEVLTANPDICHGEFPAMSKPWSDTPDGHDGGTLPGDAGTLRRDAGTSRDAGRAQQEPSSDAGPTERVRDDGGCNASGSPTSHAMLASWMLLALLLRRKS